SPFFGELQGQLLPRNLTPLPPQFSRHPLFQNLQHPGRCRLFRLADQQVHVLQHHHVPEQREPVSGAHFAQGFQKQISCPNSSQKRPPLITAESNEMQIPAAGIAFWFDFHQSRKSHPFSEERVGHPRFSTFRLPQQVVSSLGGKTSSTISRQSNWPPAQVKLIEK